MTDQIHKPGSQLNCCLLFVYDLLQNANKSVDVLVNVKFFPSQSFLKWD